MQGKITLSPELRPCVIQLVDDTKQKAWFHKWSDKSKALPRIGIVQETIAIVEFEDGTVHECYPHEIRFTDVAGPINNEKESK